MFDIKVKTSIRPISLSFLPHHRTYQPSKSANHAPVFWGLYTMLFTLSCKLLQNHLKRTRSVSVFSIYILNIRVLFKLEHNLHLEWLYLNWTVTLLPTIFRFTALSAANCILLTSKYRVFVHCMRQPSVNSPWKNHGMVLCIHFTSIIRNDVIGSQFNWTECRTISKLMRRGL